MSLFIYAVLIINFGISGDEIVLARCFHYVTGITGTSTLYTLRPYRTVVIWIAKLIQWIWSTTVLQCDRAMLCCRSDSALRFSGFPLVPHLWKITTSRRISGSCWSSHYPLVFSACHGTAILINSLWVTMLLRLPICSFFFTFFESGRIFSLSDFRKIFFLSQKVD